jgi:hypothetical protein
MLMKMIMNLKIAMQQKKVKRSEISIKKSTKPKEEATKKSPTSKSCASKVPIGRASGNIIMTKKQVYQIVLKFMISTIFPYCFKKILQL